MNKNRNNMMKEMREVSSPSVKNGKNYSQKEMIKDIGTVGNGSPLQKIKKFGKEHVKKKAKKYTDFLY